MMMRPTPPARRPLPTGPAGIQCSGSLAVSSALPPLPNRYGDPSRKGASTAVPPTKVHPYYWIEPRPSVLSPPLGVTVSKM